MRTLERIYAITVLIIFGGIVLHAPLSVWFGTMLPEYELVIKSWKELLMLLLVPVAIVLVTKRKLWPTLLHDWIFRLIVAYAVLHFIIIGVFYQGEAATLAGLAIDLRYLLYFGLVYVLLLVSPFRRRQLLMTAGGGAVVVIGFGVMQLFLPVDILASIGYSASTIAPYLTVDQNPDFVRINSTLRGPNPVGAYAVIVLALLASFITLRPKVIFANLNRQILFYLAVLSSLVVLWISYSRSALVAGIAAVSIVLLLTVARKVHRFVWITLMVIIFAIGGGLFAARDTSFVSNVILHENPDGGSITKSNDEHVKSLEYGIYRMSEQPLGVGVGSTGSASLYGESPTIIENQYLFVAHETGWFGFMLFILLTGMVLLRLWQQRTDWLSLGVLASGIGLCLIGLLLPVWADDTVAIIWWGLAAIALASGTVYARK